MSLIPQNNYHNGKKLQFYEVQNPTLLIPVLKERHPLSCMMYNQVLHFKNFKDELKFYTIEEEINSNTWIVSNNIRKDYKHNYTISAPVSIAMGKEQIAVEVKDCFLNGSVIPWDNLDGFVYITMAPIPVSNFVVEMSANEKGNTTEIHPAYLYYMETEDAQKIDIASDDPNVEIRRLDPAKGEVNFIAENWHYGLQGTAEEMSKCLSRNASSGVIVNGKCVSGVYIAAYGVLTALYTDNEYRKRGYAGLTMKSAAKEYAKDGHIPCSTVEVKNLRSLRFHDNLKMT